MSKESATMFTKIKRFSKEEMVSFTDPLVAVTMEIAAMMEEFDARSYIIHVDRSDGSTVIQLSGVKDEPKR